MQHGRKHFCTLCGSVPPSLFCPLLNYYFSHLFRLSVMQGLNLVSTWVKVPHLGTFIWLQYLNFPPCASHQTSYRSRIHYVSISILPPSLSATSCVHLVSISKLRPVPLNNFLHSFGFTCGTPVASPQFRASILLQYSKLSHTCASQQLPAFMRFQYLGFSPSSLHNFLHASSFE